MRPLAEQHQVVGVRVERDVRENRVMIIVGQLVVVELGIIAAFLVAELAHVALDRLADAGHRPFPIGRIHPRLFHHVLDRRRDLRGQVLARADRPERDQVAVVLTEAVDLQIDVVEVPHQLRMNALDVVAFVEGVDARLPVAIPLDRDVADPAHALEMIGREMRVHRVEIVVAAARPRD